MATAKGKSPEPESGNSLANLLSGMHMGDNVNVLHTNGIDFSTVNTKVMRFSTYVKLMTTPTTYYCYI